MAFVPHGSTCQADHENPDYGRCGAPAVGYCLDEQGQERLVCDAHYKTARRVIGRDDWEWAHGRFTK